ncbi:MAG: hypothetical protein ACMXYL_01860 [Candidatus Woesearchaeota archaeon]
MAVKEKKPESDYNVMNKHHSEEHLLLESSLEMIRVNIGLDNNIRILPYRMSFEGIDDSYYLGIMDWELSNRKQMRDPKVDPLRAYYALGSGLVIPELDPRRVYGSLIGNKAHTPKNLVNRIVNVPSNLYGNYSRSLRLQLEPSESYRLDVPEDITSIVRGGAQVSLETLSIEDAVRLAEDSMHDYNFH